MITRISIHTPTKGATKMEKTHHARLFHFNPHSHEGSDPKCWIQSTIRRNFNPHSHEGSDALVNALRAGFKKFQSTLPRRERRKSCKGWRIICTDFNPHSHEGSDTGIRGTDQLCYISIHTPTKGAT